MDHAKRTLLFPSRAAPRQDSRPSERPTLPTLPTVPPVTPSILELSASALESANEIQSETEITLRPGGSERLRRGARGVLEILRTRSGAPGLRVNLALVLGAGLMLLVLGPPQRLAAARPPREATMEHTPLAPRAVLTPSPPAGGCVVTGTARVLAPRAQLAAGLDVSVAANGFAVGFAASADEALGLRVDGMPLRVAERIRVRSGAVRHVAVDGAADDDGLALQVDADDAPAEPPEPAGRAFGVSRPRRAAHPVDDHDDRTARRPTRRGAVVDGDGVAVGQWHGDDSRGGVEPRPLDERAEDGLKVGVAEKQARPKRLPSHPFPALASMAC